jgi:hypothetical protein
MAIQSLSLQKKIDDANKKHVQKTKNKTQIQTIVEFTKRSNQRKSRIDILGKNQKLAPAIINLYHKIK